MEPRSIARSRVRIRPVVKLGLSIIGYIMPFLDPVAQPSADAATDSRSSHSLPNVCPDYLLAD